MRRLILAAAIVSLFAVPADATWSIVAMDKRSGQIVIGSATSVPQSILVSFPAQGLKDVQAIIIPGRGLPAAQASVDSSRRMQQFIANELERGTHTVRIIDLLQSRMPTTPSANTALSTPMAGQPAIQEAPMDESRWIGRVASKVLISNFQSREISFRAKRLSRKSITSYLRYTCSSA